MNDIILTKDGVQLFFKSKGDVCKFLNISSPTLVRYVKLYGKIGSWEYEERPRQYIAYRGDEFVDTGSKAELREKLGLASRTFDFYCTTYYKETSGDRENAVHISLMEVDYYEADVTK